MLVLDRLNKWNQNEETEKLIKITKSDSGVSGPELAMAHIRLGQFLAENMEFPADDTTVVAIMRGGLFFAMGMYFKLNCRFGVYDPKHEEFVRPDTKYIILADAVINTGNTIRKILTPDMFVACCVINEKAVADFDKQLYAVRISSNSFVGSAVQRQADMVGPDTTMRLFHLL